MQRRACQSHGGFEVDSINLGDHAMQYPGRVIKQGETDARIAKELKNRLNRVLVLKGGEAVKLDPQQPSFGPMMKSAVKLFQSRSVDSEGHALKIDGEVGSITWAALFGDDQVPVATSTTDDLLKRALAVASGEEARQVREVPPGSNRGPDVEAYLHSTGLGGGHSWCAAYVYWCFEQAARQLGRANPLFKTAGCLAHWSGAPSKGARRINASAAKADPAVLQPGMIFIMDHGGGLGHTGLIESVTGGIMTTLEGNSNVGGSREGIGVFRLTRKVNSVNKGFIDYAGL